MNGPARSFERQSCGRDPERLASVVGCECGAHRDRIAVADELLDLDPFVGEGVIDLGLLPRNPVGEGDGTIRRGDDYVLGHHLVQCSHIALLQHHQVAPHDIARIHTPTLPGACPSQLR